MKKKALFKSTKKYPLAPIVFVLASLLAVILINAEAWATSITACAAAPGLRSAWGGGWTLTTPTPGLDTIWWQGGANIVDSKTTNEHYAGPESKFAGPPLAGRTFTGAGAWTDKGDYGSVATGLGSGMSTSATTKLGNTVWFAMWNIMAGGKLGTIKPGPWNYTSKMFASDPFNITSAQLSEAGIIDTHYDLFLKVGLEAGDFTENGGIDLNVSYETSSEVTNLLNIQIDASGVTATNDDPTGLSFYLMDGIDAEPPVDETGLTSLASIEEMLLTDVSSDYTIDSPLTLGIVWEDIPLPTVDLGDGSFAKIHTNTAATETGAVPEPSAILLLSSGLFVVGIYRQRMKTK